MDFDGDKPPVHFGDEGELPFTVSKVRLENASSKADWDAYVRGHHASSIYHTSAWMDVIAEAFHKQAYCLRAETAAGTTVGVLPLIRVRSRLLGDRLVSMPYANYGGGLADSENVALSLRQEAVKITESLGVDCLELRETSHTLVGQAPKLMAEKRDKVIMRLKLPASMEGVGKLIGAKRRSQVRRPKKEGASTEIGGLELLDEFYQVFSRNMRDLGTPVYPKRFFEVIATHLHESVHIVLVRMVGQPVAGAFLIRWGETLEIPWAASHRDFNRYGVNMLLYWEAIGLAIDHGCKIFDFGRSTVDSGTYHFKRHWGAVPIECRWLSWPKSGEGESEGAVRRIGSKIWQNLPLEIANSVGPWLSPNLPW